MLEHGFIKIECEDIEEENVRHNKGQQIKNEYDLLEIEEKHSLTIGAVEVTELDATKITENERNTNDEPISHRKSYNSASGSDSNVASEEVKTKSCGTICALQQQQKLLLKCKFCDLNYDDVDNFKRHLHEVHKMFHLEEDKVQENAPRTLRKRNGLIKEQQPAGQAQSCLTEPLDSCGKIFILKNQTFSMVCGSCGCECCSLDLFEEHLRQQHHTFERCRIKSETSTETYESDSETFIRPDLIKLDNETVTETIQLKPGKRLATKRKSTVKDNKSQQEQQSPSEETPTLMDKGRRHTKKRTIDPKDQCYDDEITEENLLEEKSLLKQLVIQKSPKRISECDNKFPKSGKLTEHKKRSKNKKFKCSQCPKGFNRSSDLKIHERVHTGEKPFVCEMCNKTFRAKQNLSVHRKTHMGEACKSYECEICDKKFLRNIDRKIHLRSHTGEKPFKCDLCQRAYSSKFNLQAHLERDHVLPNSSNKQPIGRKKPGPKPLTDELARQRKLIEELQQQLLKQIKGEEKILPPKEEIPVQESPQDSNASSATSQDQLKNAYDLLNQITTTVMPLLNL